MSVGLLSLPLALPPSPVHRLTMRALPAALPPGSGIIRPRRGHGLIATCCTARGRRRWLRKAKLDKDGPDARLKRRPRARGRKPLKKRAHALALGGRASALEHLRRREELPRRQVVLAPHDVRVGVVAAVLLAPRAEVAATPAAQQRRAALVVGVRCAAARAPLREQLLLHVTLPALHVRPQGQRCAAARGLGLGVLHLFHTDLRRRKRGVNFGGAQGRGWRKSSPEPGEQMLVVGG